MNRPQSVHVPWGERPIDSGTEITPTMANSQSRRSRRHTTSPTASTSTSPRPRYWPESVGA